MNLSRKNSKSFCLLGVLAIALVTAGRAEEPAAAPDAPPSSDVPATTEPAKEHFFPLFAEKLRMKERKFELPPPYGVMALTNWLDSDWKFTSASVSLEGSPYINLPAAEKATMDLQSSTTGVTADVGILPFLDFRVGGGRVDVDANLGLIDTPISYSPIGGVVRGDK